MAGDIMLSGFDVSNSKFQDIALVYDNEEIIQSAIIHIRIIYGELDNHPNIGNNMYHRRLKASDSNLRIIEGDCKSAILQDRRVATVNSVIATLSTSNNKECNVTFNITTVDGIMLTSAVVLNLVE